MRLGLLGGTFNPPHIGHLVCATEAIGQLGLDEVAFVPVNQPPHKEIDGDPGVRPQSHQFVAYAACWEEIPDDGLPRYPEERPGYAGGR